jgi:hypothetical protein
MYLGMDVEAFNSNDVLSTYLAPGTTQIRLGLDNGTSLMYDYLYNQWGQFTNYDALDTVIFDGVQVFLGANGWLQQETPGVYSDAGSYISQYIETGWLNLAAFQGFLRAKWFLFLGTFISDHYLNVGVAYDFVPAWDPYLIKFTGTTNDVFGQSNPFGADSQFGGPFNQYQWRIFFGRQKCESVKLYFKDTQYDVVGEGFQLSGLNFQVAGKKGTWRPAATSAS